MKKLILLIMVLAVLLTASVKPPRLVRLEVVNKAGEPVKIQLQGMGYDFDAEEFKWNVGSYQWLPYQDPPMNAEGDYFDVPVTTVYTIPKDLYEIDVYYQQELDGIEGEPVVKCLSNWVPLEYVGKAAYWVQDRNRRLVVPECDQVASVLVGPKNDAFKWARWLLVVK